MTLPRELRLIEPKDFEKKLTALTDPTNVEFHIVDEDDGLTAAVESFHLPGKHNQATHGRGGMAEHADSVEVRMAHKLNSGKKLDPGVAREATMVRALHAFTSGGARDVATAMDDPHAQTVSGLFLRTVASAPANAPKLHRGMTDVPSSRVPRRGDVFDLGPTSFSTSSDIANTFTGGKIGKHKVHRGGDSVHITLKRGSRSLRVEKYSSFPNEKEWVTMGRYRVTESRITTQWIYDSSGGRFAVTRHELEIEQVGNPDDFEVTASGKFL